MRATAIALFLVIFAASGTAFAQTAWPDGWIDLQADSIIYDFPYPDTISITAIFSVRSGMLVDSFFVADMGVFLDGIPVHSSFLEISNTLDICNDKDEADCYGDCTLQLNPDGSETGECKWVNDTLLVRCHCRKKGSLWPLSVGYFGQSTITFEMDMAGAIDEPYEFNNYVSVSLIPVAEKPSTWGQIKKDYTE